MGAIYLIRHGQASFGQADYDRLSVIGHRQSTVLGQALKQLKLDVHACVRGSMTRHAETASACLWAMGIDQDSRVDPGFNEYDHDEVLRASRPDFASPEGVARALSQAADPRAEFQKLFAAAMARWTGGAHDGDYRETWPQFCARCIAALQRAVANGGSGHNTLVFTSGGAISVIVQHLLGLSDRDALRLNWIIANTSVTRLIYGNGRITLSYFNNYRHVEADRELLTYR